MARRVKAPKRARKPRAKQQFGFARLVARERKRLEKVRDGILSRKAGIDRELENVQTELTAFGSFFSTSARNVRFPRRRARRGEKRQQVLDAIKSFSDGVTRGEIIKKLNATDKSARQSVSNSLSALFKSKAVKRENGRYRAA